MAKIKKRWLDFFHLILIKKLLDIEKRILFQISFVDVASDISCFTVLLKLNFYWRRKYSKVLNAF